MVMGTLGIYTEMAKGKENGKRVLRLRWFALGCLAGVTGVWAICAIGLRVNGTDSEPIGIYWAISKPPARGHFVFALPPPKPILLEEAVWRARQQGEEQRGEVGKGVLRLDSWAGRRDIACEILKETPHRFLVRLGEDCLLPGGRQATKGQDVYVSKDAIRRDQAVCIESEIVQK
jgi:hypothetical protein